MYLAPDPFARAAQPMGPMLCLPPGLDAGIAAAAQHDPGAERADIEVFIHDVFARRFGARVPAFMPELVARRDAQGRIVAAAGIRIAHGPLFLEQYLDAPVESLIAAQAGTQPPRERIAEVGQLAATLPGQGQRLIRDLALALDARRIEWVVGTLTEELRHLFERMHVEPLQLGVADPVRLGPAAKAWGRYYEHHPKVLAGHLPSALMRLRLQARARGVGVAR